jgi:hypothetical protein
MFRFWRLLLHVSSSPQYRCPSSEFPSQSHYKDRDAPLPKSSLTCLSKSPVKKPPTSMFLLCSPYIYWVMFRFRIVLSPVSQSPQYKSPPHLQVPSTVPLWEGIRVIKDLFYISLGVPNQQGVLIILGSHLSLSPRWKYSPSRFPPNRASYRQTGPFPGTSFTYILTQRIY